MSSESFHEPLELLSEGTKDLHRAITSLVEELEAVDWYTQRAEACTDPELRAVIEHHRDEEVEHAIMNLEWVRRRMPIFDHHIRTYIFATGDITAVEKDDTGGPIEGKGGRPGGRSDGGRTGGGGNGSLNVGSLRLEKA